MKLAGIKRVEFPYTDDIAVEIGASIDYYPSMAGVAWEKIPDVINGDIFLKEILTTYLDDEDVDYPAYGYYEDVDNVLSLVIVSNNGRLKYKINDTITLEFSTPTITHKEWLEPLINEYNGVATYVEAICLFVWMMEEEGLDLENSLGVYQLDDVQGVNGEYFRELTLGNGFIRSSIKHPAQLREAAYCPSLNYDNTHCFFFAFLPDSDSDKQSLIERLEGVVNIRAYASSIFSWSSEIGNYMEMASIDDEGSYTGPSLEKDNLSERISY
jgi:hypothetical protein